MNKAIFLDRDGTINIDKDYMYRIEDFEFIQNSEVAIKKIRELGYKVIVVSNQSGIAKGYYTKNDVDILHKFINDKLEQIGTRIDGFYICPHEEKQNCNCRKPKLGMYYSAKYDFDIDFEQSFLVGDKLSDIQAATSLGSKYGLVLTGHGKEQAINELDSSCVYQDLYDFVYALVYSKKNFDDTICGGGIKCI